MLINGISGAVFTDRRVLGRSLYTGEIGELFLKEKGEGAGNIFLHEFNFSFLSLCNEN